jgi:hypothetical protein
MRNGADVVLKSVFLSFGGQHGLLAFNALLLGACAVLVVRVMRRIREGLQPGIFLGMAAESAVGGLVFGLVAGTLTALLLHGAPALMAAWQGTTSFDLPTQLMISLGAGIYEELLFRVLMVGSLAWVGRRLLGWSALVAGVVATLVGALLFSVFHYVGPYGDALELGSFTFRAVAGVLFSAMYLLRGLGITAWTHALYDVFLTLMM